MTAPAKQLSKVLFVDDEMPFLEMIERVIGLWSKDQWQIFSAQNTGKALFILQEQPIDLVVVDAQMPVVDGIQFLGLLNRKYPNVPTVVLTGFADENVRAAALANGAEMFLEKPRDIEGMESVFATLRELLRHPADTGFRGVLRRVNLQDVIQMECQGRNASILEITANNLRGLIYIKDGNVIHAQVGDRKGEAAFNELLTLSGGEFSLKPFVDPPEQSVGGSWEFLLMEASRMRDEHREESVVEHTQPGEPVSSTPVSPSSIAIRPATEPSPALFAEAGVEGFAPQIDEFLICSNKGEVLCDWQCSDINGRISFLEFLTQKSRQLGLGLHMGSFDRLEMEGPNSRVVAQLTATFGVFLRATRGTPGTTS